LTARPTAFLHVQSLRVASRALSHYAAVHLNSNNVTAIQAPPDEAFKRRNFKRDNFKRQGASVRELQFQAAG
jgi:hypothetical protein